MKSLTVLDLSGGRITGVEYNSEAPLARRLASLRLSLGERPTIAELEVLRKNIQATEAQRDKVNAQLENAIQELQLEASL